MPAKGTTVSRAPRGPTSAEVESWVGWRVDDVNGSLLGHVESVIGDGRGGVAWLVVAEFRLGDGRRFIVPAFDAVGDSGRVWSPHDRALIRSSARLVGGAGFTPQAERQLREHYAATTARRAA